MTRTVGRKVLIAMRGRTSIHLSTDGTGEFEDVQSNIQERLQEKDDKVRKIHETQQDLQLDYDQEFSQGQTAPC